MRKSVLLRCMHRKPILTPLMVRQQPALPLLFWWFFSLGCLPAFFALTNAAWLAWFGPISKFSTLTGGLIWVAFQLLGSRLACKSPARILPAGIVLTVLAISSMVPLASWTFDHSYDGNWYHLKAIQALAWEGWNPFYQYLPQDTFPFAELYVNHYAKGSWIAGASWVQLLDIQDAGRINQWIMMLAALGSGLVVALQEKRNRLLKAILVVFAAFNPVSVNLMFSHYIDGELASGLLLMMFGFYQAEKTGSRYFGFSILILAVFIANLKFTGLLYVVLIGGAWTWRQMWIAQLSPGMLVIVGLLFGLLGIGGLGYPTYVRNHLEKGHMFYPLLGENNVNKQVSETCYPADFFNTNRFERFYKSHTAEPLFIRAPEKNKQRPIFQIPLDLGIYDGAAPELNSFVPFFQEILLFTFILLLALLLQQKMPFPAWILFLLLISPVFWLEQNWMARYIPQLWFAPLLLLWHATNKRKPGILSYWLMILIGINLLIVHVRLISHQINEDRAFHAWMDDLKRNRQNIIILGWMGTDESRLKQAGVQWNRPTEMVEEKDKEKAPVYGHLHGLFVVKKPIGE